MNDWKDLSISKAAEAILFADPLDKKDFVLKALKGQYRAGQEDAQRHNSCPFCQKDPR